MSINIGPPSVEELRPRITVIGVGGAGGNAIANMIEAEIEGVDFIVANTDAQALNNAIAEHRIQLGPDITAGLGAGSRPEVGRAAAEETVEELERALDGVNMVFIAAGMGGGTGTGAAPVIAEAARRKGVLTVGVVTKPFLFEGARRMRAAEAGIEELQKHVDTLIVIPNQNLFLVAKADTTFKEAFQLADEVLQQGVRSITDLMVMPGLINLDFADVRSVMSEMGKAMMGTGEGDGENRALVAAERAIANPLLDGVSMQGAKGVIISIIGGDDMKLLEVDEAANHIRELVDADANIIWGSAFNPDLEGKIRVSVVATGIDASDENRMSTSSDVSTSDFSMSPNRGPKRPALPIPTAEERAEDAALESGDSWSGGSEEAAEPASETPRFGKPDSAPSGGGAFSAPIPQAYDADGSDDGEAEDEPLELNLDSEAAPAAATQVEDEGDSGEELLLDGSDEAAAPAEPVEAPAPAPEGGRRRGLLSSDDPSMERSGGGSTLFERMANLSRSNNAKDDDDEDDDGSALSIPRFLGRQNNQ